MTTLTALGRLEIYELQSIYAWAIDSHAPHEFARVFTSDVEANYVGYIKLTGLDNLARWMQTFHASYDGVQHIISNHWLTAESAAVT
jgi:hypothetical protein